jgi:hypothetical protein
MGTPADFLKRVARRARRGFRRAGQQVRKLPGLPPPKPEEISARHWDAYAAAGEHPQWIEIERLLDEGAGYMRSDFHVGVRPKR